MSISTTGGKNKNKKRKGTLSTAKQGKGIRMVVKTVELIETCDEPGIHIETSNAIGSIKGVVHSVDMRGKTITVSLDTGCACDNCKLVINNTGGGIGVVSSTGGSVTMNF